MKKVTAEGRAEWASYLVNNDVGGLTDEDFVELGRWLEFHCVGPDECVGADDRGGFGRPNAPYGFQLFPSNLMTFTFVVHEADYERRCG